MNAKAKTKATLATAMQQATAEPRATANVAPSRRGKKAVVLYLERDQAKRLKVLAAELETTVHALGLTALDLLFEQHDK